MSDVRVEFDLRESLNEDAPESPIDLHPRLSDVTFFSSVLIVSGADILE